MVNQHYYYQYPYNYGKQEGWHISNQYMRQDVNLQCDYMPRAYYNFNSNVNPRRRDVRKKSFHLCQRISRNTMLKHIQLKCTSEVFEPQRERNSTCKANMTEQNLLLSMEKKNSIKSKFQVLPTSLTSVLSTSHCAPSFMNPT